VAGDAPIHGLAAGNEVALLEGVMSALIARGAVMTARRLIVPAALIAAAAVVPAYAQDPPSAPEHQEAAPAPQVVERGAGRARPDDGGGGRIARPAERVQGQEVRPRERAEVAVGSAAPTPAPAAPVAPVAPAFEEQGGRRRPSGGGSGGGRSAGGGSRGGGGEGSVRPRGGVRNPDVDPGGGQVAQAVPRGRAPRPPQGAWAGSYGRRYYSGPAGLGYYFYDPWSWYGWGWPAYGAYGAWGWGGGAWNNTWGGYYGGGYGAYGGPYGWSIGGVRIKVDDRDAEVFVDGYYAGTVDDFDGIWQQLRLDDGSYRIEIRKPGYEPLTFDVRIMPGRTITYRGRLVPAP
jgi:hypothetical protein